MKLSFDAPELAPARAPPSGEQCCAWMPMSSGVQRLKVFRQSAEVKTLVSSRATSA